MPEAALSDLQPEVRWEPREALLERGLHEEIARVAKTGWLVLEVGNDQARHVAETLRSLDYADVTINRDLTGKERVVEGRR